MVRSLRQRMSFVNTNTKSGYEHTNTVAIMAPIHTHATTIQTTNQPMTSAMPNASGNTSHGCANMYSIVAHTRVATPISNIYHEYEHVHDCMRIITRPHSNTVDTRHATEKHEHATAYCHDPAYKCERVFYPREMCQSGGMGTHTRNTHNCTTLAHTATNQSSKAGTTKNNRSITRNMSIYTKNIVLSANDENISNTDTIAHADVAVVIERDDHTTSGADTIPRTNVTTMA